MGTTKRKPIYRSVGFTDAQLVNARHSAQFSGKTHKEYIGWLFEHHHKCRVINYDLLEKSGEVLPNKTCVMKITGQIGLSIAPL